jgi:phage tail-like protein
VNFSILLLGPTGSTVKRWNVISGFPVKWEGPQFNTDSTQIAIETLEIAHHGLTLGS